MTITILLCGRTRRSSARAGSMRRQRASGGHPPARRMISPPGPELDVDNGTDFLHQGSMISRPFSWRAFAMLVCAASLCAAATASARAGTACPVDPAMDPLNLPHLRAALTARTEGLIVALGSSSTQGVMASDIAHTYPAILQAALNAALPTAHVAVINRGIGGQDAPEELARLDVDVIAVRPQLVI